MENQMFSFEELKKLDDSTLLFELTTATRNTVRAREICHKNQYKHMNYESLVYSTVMSRLLNYKRDSERTDMIWRDSERTDMIWWY